MKTLRKSLALVLAVVMAFSVLGALAVPAAAFTDDEDITNVEAVAVLEAIRAIDGINGEFQPNGEMTRAQAAGIIARLVLGRNAADSLPLSSGKFTDVPSDHWASGYINYCVAMGIINGETATTFNPDGKISDVGFLKMLLAALGYGKDGEFVGSLWQVNVMSLALKGGIELADGVEVGDYTTPAIRDNMAQYAFNALGVFIVEPFYEWDAGVRHVSYYNTTANTINSTVHPRLVAVSGSDDFERLTEGWTYYGETIYNTAAALLTYTGTVTGAKIFSDLRAKGVTAADITAASDPDQYENGEVVNGYDGFIGSAYSTVPTHSGASGNGVLTEVFWAKHTPALGPVTYEFVITHVCTYLATVTRVNAATSSADRSVNMTVYTGSNGVGITGVETDDYAVGDVVLVTATTTTGTPDAVYSIEAASVIENQSVTNYVSASNVTFGGTKYNYSSHFAGADFGVANTSYSFNGTYDFYMDGYGNVIAADVYAPGTTSANYAFVRATDIATGAFGTFSTMKAKAEVVYMDGTVEILDLNVTAATAGEAGDATAQTAAGRTLVGATIAAGDPIFKLGTTWYNLKDATGTPPTALNTALVGNLYSFTLSSSKMNLTAVGSAGSVLTGNADGTVEFVANRASIGTTANTAGHYANASTKLVTLGANGTVTNYNGMANFPGATGAEWKIPAGIKVAYLRTGSIITDILVVGASSVATTSSGYAVYTGNSRSTADGTEYELYWNGTKEYKLISGGVDLSGESAKTDIYSVVENSSGTVTLTSAAVVSSAQKIVNTRDSNYLVYTDASASNLLADTYAVYDISGATSTWTDAVYSTIQKGYRVVALSSGSPAKVDAIFIVDKDPTAITALTLAAIVPANGGTPSATFALTALAPAASAVDPSGAVAWTSGASVPLVGNFAASTAYTSTFTLTAATGFTFYGIAVGTSNTGASSAMVNVTNVGAGTVTVVANTGSTLTIEILWPATGS